MTPKFSVITITYNAADTLARTIDSVSRQTRRDAVEYVIIDGASTDGTLDLINMRRGDIDTLVSEPDDGLYYAMNKGLEVATGDYVWFLNAGDEMVTPDTVEKLLDFVATWQWDALYGDTMITDDDGREIGRRRLAPPERLTEDDFKRGMVVCHQSFVARRAVAPLYDTKFKYSADYKWCLDILSQGGFVLNTRMTLSRFLDGGITKRHIPEGLKERFSIMTAHFGFVRTCLCHIPIALKFFWFWGRNGRF